METDRVRIKRLDAVVAYVYLNLWCQGFVLKKDPNYRKIKASYNCQEEDSQHRHRVLFYHGHHGPKDAGSSKDAAQRMLR